MADTQRVDFDKLWNYGDPAGTEAKFREFLPAAEASGDADYLAQLLTQIARTQGLQGRFDDAHQTLDRAERMLTDDLRHARVRCLLERGRALNSDGRPLEALPYFHQAADLATEAKLPNRAIDAVHMVAIAVVDPNVQVAWNLKGIEMVEADPSQRRWLYALYNNLGESYATLAKHEAALDAFRKRAALDSELGKEPDIYTLKDQSRMLRALGRIDEAMAIIQPINQRLDREKKPDGWISEEYAECLLASGKPAEAKLHFAVAYELLKDDPWVKRHEPAKLERLRRLASPPNPLSDSGGPS